jgi:hypothetical protein
MVVRDRQSAGHQDGQDHSDENVEKGAALSGDANTSIGEEVRPRTPGNGRLTHMQTICTIILSRELVKSNEASARALLSPQEDSDATCNGPRQGRLRREDSSPGLTPPADVCRTSRPDA